MLTQNDLADFVSAIAALKWVLIVAGILVMGAMAATAWMESE